MAALMKQVTEFLQIWAELSVKPADNSAGFCIFEIFLFLVRLNYVSAEFSQIFKNQRDR
jgi:hypothetical protein